MISTPISIVSGLTAASRRGILIKGSVYLEDGRKLRWLALDKTGTLTHGKPVQTDIQQWDAANISPLPIRLLAASLAARSDHPVSLAVAQAATEHRDRFYNVDDFKALPGRGVSGRIEGMTLYLGYRRLMEELHVCTPALEARLNGQERQGKQRLCSLMERHVLALAAVADTVNPSSAAAIADLNALGIRTLMLTGDNRYTAQAIAAQVGIDEAHGDLLPEDKMAAVESKLSPTVKVGMVGDSINDAPALRLYWFRNGCSGNQHRY